MTQFKAPDGTIYTCLVFAVHASTGWKWYGFERPETDDDDDRDIYFGYVEGYDAELGYFSLRELREVQADICLDPDLLLGIDPPVGWIRVA